MKPVKVCKEEEILRLITIGWMNKGEVMFADIKNPISVNEWRV